jgi:hypothetical protein
MRELSLAIAGKIIFLLMVSRASRPEFARGGHVSNRGVFSLLFES